MGLQPYGRAPRPASGLKPSSVAKALKVSPEAVRERVGRMERAGIIQGYEIFPNFHLLGLEAKALYLRLPDASAVEGVVQRVGVVDGIIGIHRFTEPELAIDMCVRSPADFERKVKLLRALAGEGEVIEWKVIPSVKVERRLTALDWRIIRALRGRALRPLPQVAKDLKVNSRTVKRRFERMSQEGAFVIIPLVDPAKVPGLILFELMVWMEPADAQQAFEDVTRALDDHMVCWDLSTNPGGGNFGFGLYAQRLGDIESCRRKAASIRGVRRVRPLVLQGSEERFAWFNEQIDNQIAAAIGRATPASG